MTTTHYNEGERTLQKKFGEQEIAKRIERSISNEVIKGAIGFIQKQPIAIASSVNENDQVWISLLSGANGFAELPSPTQLLFHKDQMDDSLRDVFFENIIKQKNIGLLFIELGSRRRYRINGSVESSEGHVKVSILEAYPNCPKYIQRRLITVGVKNKDESNSGDYGTLLTKEHFEWVSKADTFFVGSRSRNGQMDASHRGGTPGFIEILEDGSFKIPDYVGNSMYNTLGNIIENPSVGLLFVDFDQGKTLQLTGEATLLFDQTSTKDMKKTTDTGRYWIFKTVKWKETKHPIKWEFVDASPFNP